MLLRLLRDGAQTFARAPFEFFAIFLAVAFLIIVVLALWCPSLATKWFRDCVRPARDCVRPAQSSQTAPLLSIWERYGKPPDIEITGPPSVSGRYTTEFYRGGDGFKKGDVVEWNSRPIWRRVGTQSVADRKISYSEKHNCWYVGGNAQENKGFVRSNFFCDAKMPPEGRLSDAKWVDANKWDAKWVDSDKTKFHLRLLPRYELQQGVRPVVDKANARQDDVRPVIDKANARECELDKAKHEIQRLQAVIDGRPLPALDEDAPLGAATARWPWQAPAKLQGDVRRVHYEVLADATASFNASHIIGRGGFGAVYKGVWGGREVAIKRCDVSSKEALAEYQNELRTLSMCRHQHIVPLLGYANGPLCLVYPLMSGGSLADRLRQKQLVLKMDARLHIAMDVSLGLAYLHAAIPGTKPCIIHRDVKSANVLLDDSALARLSDAGLARQVAESGQTQTQAMGTPGYLDPEYAETLRLSTTSDVFSLGVVLLELLTGEPAVDAAATPPVLYARLRPQLPAEAIALAEKGCAFTLAGAQTLGATAKRCVARGGDERPVAAEVAALFGAKPSASASGTAVRECVVCMERPRGTRLLPCHHAALCMECATDVLACGQPCPICREPIRNFERGTFDATCAFPGASSSADSAPPAALQPPQNKSGCQQS